MRKSHLYWFLVIFILSSTGISASAAAGTLGIGVSLTDSTNYTPKSYSLLLQGDTSITVSINCDRLGELETAITDKFGNEWARGQIEGDKIVMRLKAAGMGTVYVNVRGKYDYQVRYTILATQVPARSPQDDEFASAPSLITANTQTGGHLGYRYYDKNHLDERDVFQFKIPSEGVLKVQTAADDTLSYKVELRNSTTDLIKALDSANGKAEFSYSFGKGDIGKIYFINLVQRSGYGTYGLALSYTDSGTGLNSSSQTSSGSVNLAVNCPAQQSSVYMGTGVDQSAHIAVDGKTAGRDPHDLIMTTNQNNPWWMVDLGRVAAIEQVRLYNRKNPDINTCLNVEVLLSSDGINWRKIYAHNNTPWETLTIPASSQARYVKVQLPSYGSISLYEVEVIGR